VVWPMSCSRTCKRLQLFSLTVRPRGHRSEAAQGIPTGVSSSAALAQPAVKGKTPWRQSQSCWVALGIIGIAVPDRHHNGFAFPSGVGAAIYMEEYANKRCWRISASGQFDNWPAYHRLSTESGAGHLTVRALERSPAGLIWLSDNNGAHHTVGRAGNGPA